MTTYSIYEAADKLGISVSVLRREIYMNIRKQEHRCVAD